MNFEGRREEIGIEYETGRGYKKRGLTKKF
jgi:hypothetical protein